MSARPRVVLLRGHNANVWDLRPLSGLLDEYALEVLVTGSNLHDLTGLELPQVPTPTQRDRLPPGRGAGAVAYVAGERYVGLAERLGGADIVHGAEIGTWFTAQAAGLRSRLGFKLVVTVWETLPWARTYRWPRERRYRAAILPHVDLCLAATERSRDTLLLEGVPRDRVELAPPGIDLERFAPGAGPGASNGHLVLSVGRLVWEKGHQDALRALAALRRGLVGEPPRDDVRLLIVGDGPERGRLRAYASELGVADDVEFRATVPYDAMPALYRTASALVLASLPTKAWEEQFGMVLVEAMACGTPIVATTTGAIPELLAGHGTLVAPGDWRGMARALIAGPLAGAPGARDTPCPDHMATFSAATAAGRVRDGYRRVLGRPESRPTRVAIAAVGDPLAGGTWSGIPAGLARGLRTHGVTVAGGIDATPPSPLREAALAAAAAVTGSRLDSWYTPGVHALRDRVARRRLRTLGRVEGVVLCGAEFGLPAGTRYVILADMTLAAARATHPVFAGLSQRTYDGWRRRQEAIYRRAAALLAAGHWTADSMVRDHGADPAKVHVVGLGRNHDPGPRTGAWWPPHFLFVGREWERKNGPLVLEAFRALRDDHPEARLDLVGGHPPVDEPGIAGHGVLRLTQRAEAATVERLFAEATCFVMPSTCEPFGIVYAEAAAAGVPSIATAVGGAATILGPDGGILVEPGDYDALLAAMRRVADPSTAERMGTAALARADLFTWQAVAGRVLRALAPPGVDSDRLPAFL
jgi:glycosyltransferase involved in cell wall biosynthesis